MKVRYSDGKKVCVLDAGSVVVRFENYKERGLKYSVVKQSKRLTFKGVAERFKSFKASNGVTIASLYYPDVSGSNSVFLRGKNAALDSREVVLSFFTKKQRQNALASFKKAFKEFASVGFGRCINV